MKTSIYLNLIIFCCTLFFWSCDSSDIVNNGGDDTIDPPEKIDLTIAEQRIAELSADLGAKFFALMMQEHAGDAEKTNFMISPYSLNSTLAMLWNGAKGDTKAEIETVMGFDNEDSDIVNGYFKKVGNALLEIDPLTKLAIANSIWYKKDAILKSDFKESIEKWHNAEIKGVDFSLPTTKNEMNQWCSDNTNNLINNVIEETNASDLIYLMNALYFKGQWMQDYEFKESNTRLLEFTLEDESKTTVPIMNQRNHLRQVENEVFTGVSLPFGNNAFSMRLFLPQEGVSLNEMVSELATPGYQASNGEWEIGAINLFMPKFKIAYKHSYNDVLTKMGMEKTFSGEGDYSGAFEGLDMSVSNVEQHTFLEVNEKGAEAAAVTVVNGTTAPLFRAVVFNRPFVFQIRENSTGCVLFMGRVGNPAMQ